MDVVSNSMNHNDVNCIRLIQIDPVRNSQMQSIASVLLPGYLRRILEDSRNNLSEM